MSLALCPQVVSQAPQHFESLVVTGSRHLSVQFSSVQFSSVQDGIYALGKASMRSTPSLRSFPNVAFETVPMLVWLTMGPFLVLSRNFVERLLPLSTPLSCRRSMVWCPWLCARSSCLKLLNTSDLSRRKPPAMVAFFSASLNLLCHFHWLRHVQGS